MIVSYKESDIAILIDYLKKQQSDEADKMIHILFAHRIKDINPVKENGWLPNNP